MGNVETNITLRANGHRSVPLNRFDGFSFFMIWHTFSKLDDRKQ